MPNARLRRQNRRPPTGPNESPAVLARMRAELAVRLDGLRATIMAKRRDCIARGLTVKPLDPADGWSPEELAAGNPVP